jgi:hypothetical protein
MSFLAKWKDDPRKDEILQALQEGVTNASVARRFQLSAGQVAGLAYRLRRDGRLKRPPRTREEIGNGRDVHRRLMKKIRSAKRIGFHDRAADARAKLLLAIERQQATPRTPVEENPFLGTQQALEGMTLMDRAVTKRVPLHALEPHHCRWPIGNPRHPDFGYCGERKYTGHPSYCARHARMSMACKPLTRPQPMGVSA